MIENCGIIPPRRDDILGFRKDGYTGECILPNCHSGPHLLLTPEGNYKKWQTDYDCDPGCSCQYEDGDECYVYENITKEEAQKIIKECL